MSTWRVLSICLLLLVLSACAGQEATPQVSSLNTNSVSPQKQAFVVPTPASSEVGTVTGKLLKVQKDGGTRPFTGLPVYLGSIYKTNQGVDGLVGVDKAKAPHATVDDQGNFVFTNVQPGRYGFMADTPRGVILLNDPSSGGDFIIEVDGGKVKDLGELKYDIPLDL
jgi:hypothetical protein